MARLPDRQPVAITPENVYDAIELSLNLAVRAEMPDVARHLEEAMAATGVPARTYRTRTPDA